MNPPALRNEWIPLNHLKDSPENMRRRGQADDKLNDLCNSIQKFGVLFPLLVEAHQDPELQKQGFFQVAAGDRRLDALKALQAEGEIPEDFPVFCRVIESGHAIAYSLAENMVRVPPKPIEVFEGIQKLSQAGEGVREIALSLGASQAYIREVLKIGRVHEAIREAAHTENLSLAALSAYAAGSDPEAQLRCYESAGPDADPQSIREELAGQTRAADSPGMRFISQEAYQEEGGEIQHNLLSQGAEGDAGQAEATNPALLDRLVREKLEAQDEAGRQETGIERSELCESPAEYHMAKALYAEPDGSEEPSSLIRLVGFDDEGQPVSEVRRDTDTPFADSLAGDPDEGGEDEPAMGPGGDPRPWPAKLIKALHETRAEWLAMGLRQATAGGGPETALRIWTAAGLLALGHPRPGPGEATASPVQLHASHWKSLPGPAAAFSPEEPPDPMPGSFAEWLEWLETLDPGDLAATAGAAFAALLAGPGTGDEDTAMALAKEAGLDWSRSWKPHMEGARYFHELPKRSLVRIAEDLGGAEAGEWVQNLGTRNHAADFLALCFRCAAEGAERDAMKKLEDFRALHQLPEDAGESLFEACRNWTPPGFAPDAALPKG